MRGKVHILFSFKDGPYGGGNQFLKALRDKFREANWYTENPAQADIFLFNSFQDIRAVLRMKHRFPEKTYVHRVDGPISLYRDSSSDSIDQLIFSLNDALADATVFQSCFSLKQNRRLGMPEKEFETIIFNAPDPKVFFPAGTPMTPTYNRKVRLISTSWSSNPMKGFNAYRYLDEHLNFSKYDYVFVGNSPIKFKNITIIPPKTSREIAILLRESDIFITASRKDPCSNSLIEALSCGLPAVALNDGGHPELIRNGGELFETPQEIQQKLDLIVNAYSSYQNGIHSFDIEEKLNEYITFFTSILDKKNAGQLSSKKMTIGKYIAIFMKSLLERV